MSFALSLSKGETVGLSSLQYPIHHHRRAERDKSLFRVNYGFIKKIIPQFILNAEDGSRIQYGMTIRENSDVKDFLTVANHCNRGSIGRLRDYCLFANASADFLCDAKFFIRLPIISIDKNPRLM